MTLTEHLEDLRWCLLKSVFAVFRRFDGRLFIFRLYFWFYGGAAAAKSAARAGFDWHQQLLKLFSVEIEVALAAGRFFHLPGYILSDLAVYRARVIEAAKRNGCFLLFCARRFFFSADRFSVIGSFSRSHLSISSSSTKPWA